MPAGVGQAVHAPGIQAGDAGRGAEQEAGGGARGDQSRLGAGDLGDDLGGARLQLGHLDAVLRCLDHGRGHLRAHDAAGQAGRMALGVDDRAHAQTLVDVGHRPLRARWRALELLAFSAR